MILHSCKTRTNDECIITKEERRAVMEQVATGNFVYGIDRAQDLLHHKDHVVRCRRASDHFTIPMKRNLFNLLTIHVYVNDQPCTFIIDTGAQISGIREDKARALRLPATGQTLTIGSIGGKEQTLNGLYISKFQFGAFTYDHIPMIALHETIFPFYFKSFDILHFDGILGWDILRTLDFEIDDIANEFKVLHNRYRFDHPNMIKGSFPLFMTKTPEGKVGIFGFDSGSKKSWMGVESIAKFHYHIKEEGIAMGFGVHGLEKLEMKIVSDVVLDLYKARIHLKDTGTGRVNLFHNFAFDGVLGNEISKGRRLRIINSKEMVLIA